MPEKYKAAKDTDLNLKKYIHYVIYLLPISFVTFDESVGFDPLFQKN